MDILIQIFLGLLALAALAALAASASPSIVSNHLRKKRKLGSTDKNADLSLLLMATGWVALMTGGVYGFLFFIPDSWFDGSGRYGVAIALGGMFGFHLFHQLGEYAGLYEQETLLREKLIAEERCHKYTDQFYSTATKDWIASELSDLTQQVDRTYAGRKRDDLDLKSEAELQSLYLQQAHLEILQNRLQQKPA
jgi:hypothetical protein